MNLEEAEFRLYKEYKKHLNEDHIGLKNKGNLVSMELLIKHYKCFLFDAWGTLYVRDKIYPEIPDLIETLRQENKQIRIVTNSSSMTVRQIQQSLEAKGLLFHPAEIISSGNLLAPLVNKMKITEAFHFGKLDSMAVFEEAGLIHTENPASKTVILCSVPVDSQELAQQQELARQILSQENSQLLIMNPDAAAPSPEGERYPVAGIVGAKLAENTPAQVIRIGKPFPLIFQQAMQSLFPILGSVVMIGDTLGTDIAGANSQGIDTALVLRGNSHPDSFRDLAYELNIRPTYVLESLEVPPPPKREPPSFFE